MLSYHFCSQITMTFSASKNTINNSSFICNSDKNKQVSTVIEERFQAKQVPPLSELVVGDEIRGKVDWMVDFAIIGNPKCGTTFLMVRFPMTRERYRLFLQIYSLCSILTVAYPFLLPLSFTQHWLSRAHDTHVHNGEVCALSRGFLSHQG